MEFEWDEAKARSNAHKHGVTFEEGIEVFGDLCHVVSDAKSGAEVRQKAIGWVGDRMIAVIFTKRGVVFRLISARPAKRTERAIHGNRSLHARSE